VVAIVTALQKAIRSLALLSLSLAASGCLEIEITTQVRRDGTLLRKEVVSGDSAEVLDLGFVSPVDSTWTLTLSRPPEGSNEHSFERIASKLFAGPEEMSVPTRDTARGTLPVRAWIDRRFAWFYTDITYHEVYLKWNPFNFIPLGEYVSTADLARSMDFAAAGRRATREDSLARERVGRNWTEWMVRDMFEGYYAELVKGVKLLNDPSLSPSLVASHKEEIFRKCGKWWTSAASMDTVAVVIRSLLKNPKTGGAIQANEVGFRRHAANLDLVAKVTGKLKRVNIDMPGVFLDSNAPDVEGNRGSWKGVADMSYAADYDLWMASRVVNWWIVILTLAAILAGIGYLALRGRGKADTSSLSP
jgi:hypothetical protein